MRRATCPLTPSSIALKREIEELKQQMEQYRLKSPTQQAVEQAKAQLAYRGYLEKSKKSVQRPRKENTKLKALI